MTEAELRRLLNACGKQLEKVARRNGVEKPLFVLLLFNDPKLAQYVANCEREDIIQAMRECAGRLEAREDVRR